MYQEHQRLSVTKFSLRRWSIKGGRKIRDVSPSALGRPRKARWSRVLYTSLPWCLSANRISSRLYLLITAAGLCSCTGNRPRIAHCYARGVKQLSPVNECSGLERDCARDHNDVSAASFPRNIARYAGFTRVSLVLISFSDLICVFTRSNLSVCSTELVATIFRSGVIV